jgi:hypothetical protein
VRHLPEKGHRVLESRQFGALVVVADGPARPGERAALLQRKIPDQTHAPARPAEQGALFGRGVQPDKDGLALDHGSDHDPVCI